MKIASRGRDFETERHLHFQGKEGEGSIGTLKIKISVDSVSTDEMNAELEKLASEMEERAWKIIAAQEAPRQTYYDTI